MHDKRPTVLVSLHSFTPVYAGVARPWHIGALYNRDSVLPHLLLKHLRSESDLIVGDNEPYAVNDLTDYTIPVHGEARGLVNTGIDCSAGRNHKARHQDHSFTMNKPKHTRKLDRSAASSASRTVTASIGKPRTSAPWPGESPAMRID